MTKRQIGLAVLGVVTLAACAVLLLRSSAPRPRCLVTVSLVVVTNDASGTRQATLRLVNAGRHAVVLVPTFGLENRSGQWRTNLVPPRALTSGTNLVGILPFHPRSKILKARETCEVTIPLPFDDSGWRASFWYLEIRPPLVEAVDELSAKFGRVKQHQGQIMVSTDWIER